MDKISITSSVIGGLEDLPQNQIAPAFGPTLDRVDSPLLTSEEQAAKARHKLEI
jgi:hypothetical protein